jgi:hypothetical protein
MQLNDLEAAIARLSDDDRGTLESLVAGELDQPWRPNPGPQTAALESEADLLLYGGAAGGGKSSLLLGCAVRNHRRALILRRKSVELDGLIAESQAMLAGRGSFNKVERHWVFANGAIKGGASLKFGGMKDADDWRDYAGRARDYIGFDEAAEFLEEQIASLIGWLRSTDPGQRCRVVLASNPPRGGDGAWIVRWFAPWLDPLYPEPAEPGELRWAVNAGNRLIWRDGPGTIEIDGETYTALSRSFIPARLDDNPYLSETSYRAGLQSLPEPLRSQLLNGDFSAGREDDAWQVIPSAWVAAASRRWADAPRDAGDGRRRRMIALSADIAMGGRDDTVLAALCEDAWFAPLTARRGIDTRDGRTIATLMAAERLDNADLSVDLTGGWGAAARQALQDDLGMSCAGLVASAGSPGRTADGRFGFLNQRAEWWWRFREALDPASGDAVKLPPDQRLAAELATPCWRLKGTQVQIEDKDEIRKRLGTSTDRADAVIQAWSRREAALQAHTTGAMPADGWRAAEDDEAVLDW